VSGQIEPCAAAAFFPWRPWCRGYIRAQSEGAYGPAYLNDLSQPLVRGRGV